MTREEFYEKYGDVKVRFSNYYKYSFTFRAELPDGSTLSCSYGGNSDDIYGCEVDVDSEVTINNLEPYCGGVYKDGEEVESFYEY